MLRLNQDSEVFSNGETLSPKHQDTVIHEFYFNAIFFFICVSVMKHNITNTGHYSDTLTWSRLVII